MPVVLTSHSTDFLKRLESSGPLELVEGVTPWLSVPADEVDQQLDGDRRQDLIKAISELNRRCALGDSEAFYAQQLLLARIYALITQLPNALTAEGSVAIHQVTRELERALIERENQQVDPAFVAAAPTQPKEFVSWLRTYARQQPAYKHPYYVDFISNDATEADLRTYVIQESVVDGRFDDLLAMMQVGAQGNPKLEIASNYWDEMGNGDPEQVHTHLFNKIFEVFNITEGELADALTAEALLSGNLAVLLCRYRQFYPEAVGFLGVTEWFAPDRFVHVVKAWERLGLPEVGIVYHRLHITIDAQHAAGWFHRVVGPAAESDFMRAGITRGVLWRVNSSARYLDERLARVR